MAKVDIQLWVTRKGKGTDLQFINTEAYIKQIENYTFEAMNERSHKTLSVSPTTDKYIKEHDALPHQYYVWLRKAEQDNIERKSRRLCFQARKLTVDLVLDSFMKVKIPQGSVHRQAKELFNAVSVAKWRLRMAGAD